MPFTQAGQLARETPFARPDDPLGLVAENLRESHYGTIPVVEGDVIGLLPGQDGSENVSESRRRGKTPLRLLGLIDERDLSEAVMPILQGAGAGQMPSARPGLEPYTNGHGPFSPAGLPPIPSPGEAPRSSTPYDATEPHTSTQSPFLTHPHEALQAASKGFYGNGVHGNATQPALADAQTATRDISTLTAGSVMRPLVGIVQADASLHRALLILDGYDCNALPVVDAAGNYRGMVSRSDIVAALGQQVRPPVVGGMATPLGVWLTTGSLSAGAPPLGLALSGALMAFCLWGVHTVLSVTLQYIDPQLAMMFISGRIGIYSSASNWLNLAFTAIEGLLFLMTFRLLPISGVHAAEHQTVWAIERGLPLRPEFVRQMPRAHPRCGTNLMALAGLIKITLGHLPTFDASLVLITLLFIYLTWRNFGTLMQEWFTTRPPSAKQLDSGIKAGVELMQKYQAQPHVMGSFGSRLLNSGLIYAALGIIITSAFLDWGFGWVLSQWAR